MKHGIMKLVYKDEILRTRQYWGIQHRKDIIEYWGKFYGSKFAECFIHLIPVINSNAVHGKTGRNMRYKKYIDTPVNKYAKTGKFANMRKTRTAQDTHLDNHKPYH